MLFCVFSIRQPVCRTIQSASGRKFSRKSYIPNHQHRTPGEARAESSQENLVALFDFALEFVKTQGDGSRRRIAGVLDVDKHFLIGNPCTRTYSLDDTEIGLMRH